MSMEAAGRDEMLTPVNLSKENEALKGNMMLSFMNIIDSYNNYSMFGRI